jgi:hypothetical protein
VQSSGEFRRENAVSRPGGQRSKPVIASVSDAIQSQELDGFVARAPRHDAKPH